MASIEPQRQWKASSPWEKSESWELLKRSQGYLIDVGKYLIEGDEADTSPVSVCSLACQWAMGTNGNTPLEIFKTWLDMVKWWTFDSNQLVYVNCIRSYSLLKRILIWMAIIVLDQDFIKFCMCAEHLSCSFFPSLFFMDVQQAFSWVNMFYDLYIQWLLLIFFTI